MRKGGRVGVFCFSFSFSFWCVYVCIGGRWGRIGRGRRDKAKRREREEGGQRKNFPPFLNFSGQDMVYVHISLSNSPMPFHSCISYHIPSPK